MLQALGGSIGNNFGYYAKCLVQHLPTEQKDRLVELLDIPESAKWLNWSLFAVLILLFCVLYNIKLALPAYIFFLQFQIWSVSVIFLFHFSSLILPFFQSCLFIYLFFLLVSGFYLKASVYRLFLSFWSITVTVFSSEHEIMW